MQNLATPLSDEELDTLEDFLLERMDDEELPGKSDGGVVTLAELDGMVTAAISGPLSFSPRTWFAALWGDYLPVFRDDEHAQAVFNLFRRHVNTVVQMLAESPEEFVPLVMEHWVGDRTYAVYDEWCEGYLRGVGMAATQWRAAGAEVAQLLAPIQAFTEQGNWSAHSLGEADVERLRIQVDKSVRRLHLYWQLRRPRVAFPFGTEFDHEGPGVGREDPCPCGSGKFFRKCCLQ